MHTTLTDQEFEKRFADCSFPVEDFSHEAHLRLAWIHIRKYGAERAVEHIQEQLKQFVAHAGAEDKYHVTLTIAAVRAVHRFMQKSDPGSFDGFIAEHPELKTRFRELINSHYSMDIFTSDEARIRFVEPDVQSFG